MAKSISLMLELLKRKPSCRKVHLPYKQMKGSRIRLSEEDTEKIQKLIEIVHELLGKTAFDVNISSSNLIRVSAFTIGNIKFDINAGTKNMMKIVEESGIKSRRQDFLKLLETN